MGFPTHLIQLTSLLYLDQQAAVRINGETTTWFDIKQGVRQGCILSPYLFNLYTENIMRNVREDVDKEYYDAITIGGYEIPEIRYADDTVLLSTTQKGMEKLIMSVRKNSEEQNLYLNAKKTKLMTTDKTNKAAEICINEEKLEEVESFEYLGSLLTNNGDTMREIKRRTSIALQKVKQIKNLWRGADRTTKIRFLRACIFPIATYACETWTLNKTAEKHINAFECKCYRRVLQISWTQKRTNISILQELNIEEGWLVKRIKERKLKYFGHIKRHDNLEKTVLEGYIMGKRKRGRPRRRWLQDIVDDLEMDATAAGHLAHNREAYRSAVWEAKFRKGHANE